MGARGIHAAFMGPSAPGLSWLLSMWPSQMGGPGWAWLGCPTAGDTQSRRRPAFTGPQIWTSELAA